MSLSLLIFLTILVVGLAATVFVDLSWGVCLYVLLYFIFPAFRWWYTIPRFRFTLIVGTVLLILFIIKHKEYNLTKLSNFPQIRWLLFMVILMGIISFYPVWPEEHHKYLILQIKQLVFLVLAFKIIDSPKKLNNVLMAYILGCGYIGYIAYYLGRNADGRVEGIGMPDGPNANTTSAVLITSIPIIFYFLFKGKNWQRVICVIILPFILNGIILINSRGAFLGLAIGMIFYLGSLFLKKLISNKERLFIFVIAVFLAVSFYYLADTTFWQRMDSINEVDISETENLVSTGANRINFWLASIDLVKEYPFGTGAGGFEYLSPQILPEEYLSRRTGTIVVHSTYFEALTDFGYIGILLITGFILSTFLTMRKVEKSLQLNKQTESLALGNAIVASFITYLVAIIFINRLYAEVFYWLMLFTACFANIYFFLPEAPNNLTKHDD